MSKRLGQHFLVRRRVLERIAGAACPEREPLVVEIGPGRGALTEFLLARAERVIAIELDAALAAGLRERFPSLELLQADVLDVDLAQWGPAVFAGNLPYYISSPILAKLFAARGVLRRAVVLLQKEVAARLAAQPGSRDYGFLTVEANLFTIPELLFPVAPAAFRPPPKVDSAVVRLTPRPEAPLDSAGFLEFAGRAFHQKRKTLRNNLRPHYGAQVDAWPDAGLRAEQLSLDRLQELYRRLNA